MSEQKKLFDEESADGGGRRLNHKANQEGGEMTFTYVNPENAPQSDGNAKIKVIGVGGAGGNAVNNMIQEELAGVRFIVANTDLQALNVSKAPNRIQIGGGLTEGLGAGANPDIGRDAALESADDIRAALDDSHMVFITAGFGGGTGTGAAPVIAEICKELGVLTVAVVSRPFSFEGKKRTRQAEEGIAQLKDVADTVITIPNDRLRGIAPKNATMIDMFRKADEILFHSVKGITDLIMKPGLVNLDFADVKTTMGKAGMALMGIGISEGENRATEAAERAISHPLLEDISIARAKGVLMNITATSDMRMDEVMEASDRIYKEVGDEAEIIWGTAVDDTIGDEFRVTVIATGIGGPEVRDARVPKRNRESALRGRVRDVTPEDLQNAVDLDEPTFIRRQHAVGEHSGAQYRGYKGIVIDNDLDIPTFLRRKAD